MVSTLIVRENDQCDPKEEEDPELITMIEKGIDFISIFLHLNLEPVYPEDKISLSIVEKTAKAWNESQRNSSPRGNERAVNSTAVQNELEIESKLSSLLFLLNRA